MKQKELSKLREFGKQYLSLLPWSVLNSIITIVVFVKLYSFGNEEDLWICSWNILLLPLLFLLAIKIFSFIFEQKVNSYLKVFLLFYAFLWGLFLISQSFLFLAFIYIFPFTICPLILYHWKTWVKVEKMSLKSIAKDYLVLWSATFALSVLLAIYWAFYPGDTAASPDMVFLILMLVSLIPIAIFMFIYRVVFYILSQNISRIHLLVVGALSIVMTYAIDFLESSNQITYPIWRIILGITLVGIYLGLVKIIKKVSKPRNY